MATLTWADRELLILEAFNYGYERGDLVQNSAALAEIRVADRVTSRQAAVGVHKPSRAVQKSGSLVVAETPEHAGDREDRSHGGLHSTRRADLEQKARAPLMGVAHTVQSAAGNVNALALGQPASLAAEMDAE